MDSIENYGRYRDVDGDGIPYRTLPGSGLIVYRRIGHDEDGTYSETDVYKLMGLNADDGQGQVTSTDCS